MTMKKTLSLFALATLVMLTVGCDKIDINNTHKPYEIQGGGKTVLIKDFTGARCVNCPGAAETAHELQHQLGEDRVFLLSVHAGFLAMPLGQFPDFTTPEGTQWYNDNASNPLFTVDHVALTEGNTLYVEQVDSPLAEALAEPQTFAISTVNTYDATARQLRVESCVEALEDVTGSLYFTACLVEDSIVGRQVVPGGIDTAYVFRNVFRGTLNGFDGERVGNGQVYLGDESNFSYTVDLDSAYNEDQCYVMTYVYNKANGKILQTAFDKVR